MGHLYYFDSASLGKLLTSVGFINVENLTGEADFGVDLDFAEKSGLLKLSPEELAKVKETARLDALKGPANGRGEGLIMCARKPWDSVLQESAYSETIPRQAFKSVARRLPGTAAWGKLPRIRRSTTSKWPQTVGHHRGMDHRKGNELAG